MYFRSFVSVLVQYLVLPQGSPVVRCLDMDFKKIGRVLYVAVCREPRERAGKGL